MADAQVSSETPARRPPSAGVRKRAASPRAARQRATTEKQDDDEEKAPLTEDIEPDEEAPIYTITPISKWHPDRVRMWLALSSVALVGLTYVGMFVLIMTGATGQEIALWCTTISGATGIAGSAVTFFFTTRTRNSTRNAS